MIVVDKITKVFDQDLLKKNTTALKEVSFQLSEGQIVGLLGGNGAGKTTLYKILLGFINQTSGTIDFGNLNRNEIGFMPERPYYHLSLTGREYLNFMGQLSNLSKNDLENNKNKIGEKLDILWAQDKKLKSYSKGMLQRIGFLASLIHQPRLILLDEPLSGLDPVGRKLFKDLIIDLQKEGKTIFFSSHILPEVEEICSKIVYLRKGQVHYSGDLLNLLASANEQEFLITAITEVIGLENVIELKNVLENKRRQFICEKKNLKKGLEYLWENKSEIVSINPNKMKLEDLFYEEEIKRVN